MLDCRYQLQTEPIYKFFIIWSNLIRVLYRQTIWNVLIVTCWMAEVPLWHIYSAFVAFSGTITSQRCAWRMEIQAQVSGLSHSYMSALRYAISGPLLCYIGPVASNVTGDIDRSYDNMFTNDAMYKSFYLLTVAVCVGNSANATDNPEVPAGSGTAGSDFSVACILWYPVGPRPAQQVWITWTVSSGTSAGTQAAAGEMAQRGQGFTFSFSFTTLNNVIIMSVCQICCRDVVLWWDSLAPFHCFTSYFLYVSAVSSFGFSCISLCVSSTKCGNRYTPVCPSVQHVVV